MHRPSLLSLLLLLSLARPVAAQPYADRFVWIFGWNLNQDGDVAEISRVLETAGKHKLNGAVVSFGLDTLCKKPPEFFRRLDQVKQACDRNGLELIPSIFSVGYGGSALAHDRNLAEGVGVRNALFLVRGNEARLVPEDPAPLANGGFEDFTGNKLNAFNFHDQPGVVSVVDTQTRHGGNASLRLENFATDPHGRARVMQEIRLRPHRSYRLSLWVKTEGLQPSNAFRIMALAGDRELAPRTFRLPETTDWRKITMIFNSMAHESVKLYTGVWSGKAGKVWLDDLTVEEVGPLNVLHRPGTPVAVRSEDESVLYTEGKDYAPLVDPDYHVSRVDRNAPPLKLLPGSRIRDGQRLRVSWYHSMVVYDSQITLCMAEPALYEIYDHEAKLLAEHLRPKRILLNMDEVRMGGTCQACAGRNMGELLGECITKQAQIVRKHMPGATIYVWSDMLDPNHNAHGNYYLVEGDFTGSWNHVPKDLIAAVWGGSPREKSLRFLSEQGFATLVACYYDADDLRDVKNWLTLARQTPNVRGFMYTPWEKKYDLLPAFGDLLTAQP